MRNKKIVIYTLALVFVFLSVGASQTFAQLPDAQSTNWRVENAVSMTPEKLGKIAWGSAYEKYVRLENRATADLPDAAAQADSSVNEKFRLEILKLAADTKAGGKAVTFARPQIRQPHRYNLSKSTKIAIVVAAAVAVVAVIFIIKRCNNEPGTC